MACFVAPATVALATSVARKVVEKRERAAAPKPPDAHNAGVPAKWTQRLGWLNAMLWGGTVMLVLDHLFSGELTADPPFLTALTTPGQIGPVVREVLVTGGAMTGAVFVVWAVMVVVAEVRSRARLAHDS